MSEKQHIDVVQIDTGIPIPTSKYPLRSLNVGESFLVPLENRNSVQAQVSRLKATTDREFVVRKMDEETVRVWRTK
jgi:hypothetical protein